MHTAICSFEDRAEAQRAVDRLVDSGFDKHDVHLSQRQADGTPVDGTLVEGEGADRTGQSNDHWDGLEREVAVSRERIERFGNFFSRLFGRDEGTDHADRYSGAVERGLYVVVVDGRDEADARRAQEVLHGMNGADMNVVHRPAHPPLRDIGGAQQTSGVEQSLGTARSGMSSSNDADVKREGEFPRERATASQGWGEQRALELRDQPDPNDVTHAPGIRYADDRDDKPK